MKTINNYIVERIRVDNIKPHDPILKKAEEGTPVDWSNATFATGGSINTKLDLRSIFDTYIHAEDFSNFSSSTRILYQVILNTNPNNFYIDQKFQFDTTTLRLRLQYDPKSGKCISYNYSIDGHKGYMRYKSWHEKLFNKLNPIIFSTDPNSPDAYDELAKCIIAFFIYINGDENKAERIFNI
jgi:hypothetical protein